MIRVGVLCNGDRLQRWQAEALRQLLAVPGVEAVVAVHPADDGVAAPRHGLDQKLYRRYRRRHTPPAMHDVDATDLIGHLPSVRCRTERRGPRESFREEDLRAIATHRPDVLLRFAFNILEGGILTVATHGVWSFHHGDPAKFRGGPPGLWEIVHGDPVTGAVLQRLTERLDGGEILRQGWFRTIDHSLAETVDTVLMHSACWPAQVACELLLGHADAAHGPLPSALGKLYRYPGTLNFLRFRWTEAANKLAFHRNELRRHEEWNIGVLHQPIASLLDEEASHNVRWLPAPAAGQFRADPFGYHDGEGRLNVLYERFAYDQGRGTLARLRPKADNVLKRSRTMLDNGAHLSYPYVVERGGTVYVVPEQADTGRVDLYRVDLENDMLVPVATLLHQALFDPTLLEHDGRWWLFGTKAPLTNVALHLYHAERFEGPYTPHPLNPVKFDIRSARPAGTPFVHNGALYRPAQDSSRTYGGRIALNRVIELGTTRFREETVRWVDPLPGPWNEGLHTVCAMGTFTLVDGKRHLTVAARREAVKRRKLDNLKRRGR